MFVCDTHENQIQYKSVFSTRNLLVAFLWFILFLASAFLREVSAAEEPKLIDGEKLVDLYRTKVPVTFGMYLDLHLKVFSIQNSDYTHQVKAYIGASGGVQMHLEFQRERLARKKSLAEDFIEETSMKIKREAEKLLKNLWALYPAEIPDHTFLTQKELVNTFIFLNGQQIGFADGENFYWRQQKKEDKVVTNNWRGKPRPRTAQ